MLQVSEVRGWQGMEHVSCSRYILVAAIEQIKVELRKKGVDILIFAYSSRGMQSTTAEKM